MCWSVSAGSGNRKFDLSVVKQSFAVFALSNNDVYIMWESCCG